VIRNALQSRNCVSICK